MSNTEVMLAKYKEASFRADEMIEALQRTAELQQTVIEMLHKEIGRLERLIGELKAAI